MRKSVWDSRSTKTKTKRWKPPKVGVGTGKMCPWNNNLVCLAKDAANFWLRAAGRKLGPNRPKPGQPIEGKNGSKHDQKAADTLPERTPSTNWDTKTRWCSSHSRQAPFSVIMDDFGPVLRPPRACFGPAPAPAFSGAQRPIAGGRREFRGPKMGATEPQRGVLSMEPFWARRGPSGAGCWLLVAACCLRLARRQAPPVV